MLTTAQLPQSADAERLTQRSEEILQHALPPVSRPEIRTAESELTEEGFHIAADHILDVVEWSPTGTPQPRAR